MLTITLPPARFFNEETEEFVSFPKTTLKLEHSLISVSKWESKWKKSYLSSNGLNRDEFLDYVRCMSLDPNMDPATVLRIRPEDATKILEYIRDPMTATTFSKHGNRSHGRQSIVTAEIIYYWMVSFGIPFECEKWHLNRLLALIEVCGAKQNPSKMNAMDAASMRRAMNESRRKKYGTRG